MKTARDAIIDIMHDLESSVGTTALNSPDIHDEFNYAIDELIDAFGWHPIERAAEFGVRDAPPGKQWGPRVIVLVRGHNAKRATVYVAYYDPDTKAEHPEPYWRTINTTAEWSRRNQPTHFLRTYAAG
jgi:hypothetical protein